MIALCIGRKEQGKSTLGYHLVREAYTRVIFDPKGHFTTSAIVTPDATELYELMNDETEIIVKPPMRVPEVFERVCDEVLAWANDNPEEDFAFLVDEAFYCKTHEVGVPDSFDRLMRTIKADRVRIVLTVHQPKHLATDIRAMANHFFIFQTTQEHDLRVLSERCGEEFVTPVPNLARYEVMHWNDDKQVANKLIDSKKWFVDIHPARTVPHPIVREATIL